MSMSITIITTSRIYYTMKNSCRKKFSLNISHNKINMLVSNFQDYTTEIDLCYHQELGVGTDILIAWNPQRWSSRIIAEGFYVSMSASQRNLSPRLMLAAIAF
ncbi:hypothetical protein HAX54_008218, partial [Datura stramonium]|nr:hypothetical protein [Datura stramonium]